MRINENYVGIVLFRERLLVGGATANSGKVLPFDQHECCHAGETGKPALQADLLTSAHWKHIQTQSRTTKRVVHLISLHRPFHSIWLSAGRGNTHVGQTAKPKLN